MLRQKSSPLVTTAYVCKCTGVNARVTLLLKAKILAKHSFELTKTCSPSCEHNIHTPETPASTVGRTMAFLLLDLCFKCTESSYSLG